MQMKKFFQFFSFLALLPIASQAQITIQASDVNPLGVFATQSKDTTLDATITPGGTGEQTWDFSALKAQTTDSLKFYTADQTPYASLFPGANLAATLDSTAIIYLVKNNDKIASLGTFGSLYIDPLTITTGFTYTPAQTLIKFPMEYGQTYTESVVGSARVTGAEVQYPVFDSVLYRTFLSRTVTVDAYGELTTPIGVFDVLRTTEVEVSLDTITGLSNGVWHQLFVTPAKTVTTNNWWTNQNGLGFPVVQYKVSPETGTSALWLNELVSGIHDSQNFLKFDISPNPTSSFLRAKLPDGFVGQLVVLDINGRMMLTQSNASGETNLNIQSLQAGSFILVLQDKKGKVVGFERFEVVR